MHSPACLRCGSSMSPGYVKDQAHGSNQLPRWIEGDPRRAFFGGIKQPPRAEQLPVGGFRCVKCGWLDLYAGREFEAK